MSPNAMAHHDRDIGIVPISLAAFGEYVGDALYTHDSVYLDDNAAGYLTLSAGQKAARGKLAPAGGEKFSGLKKT